MSPAWATHYWCPNSLESHCLLPSVEHNTVYGCFAWWYTYNTAKEFTTSGYSGNTRQGKIFKNRLLHLGSGVVWWGRIRAVQDSGSIATWYSIARSCGRVTSVLFTWLPSLADPKASISRLRSLATTFLKAALCMTQSKSASLSSVNEVNSAMQDSVSFRNDKRARKSATTKVFYLYISFISLIWKALWAKKHLMHIVHHQGVGHDSFFTDVSVDRYLYCYNQH